MNSFQCFLFLSSILLLIFFSKSFEVECNEIDENRFEGNTMESEDVLINKRLWKLWKKDFGYNEIQDNNLKQIMKLSRASSLFDFLFHVMRSKDKNMYFP